MAQTDLNQVLQVFLKNKNIFLAVVVLVISLYGGIALYGQYSTKLTNLKSQIQEKNQKIDLVGNLDKSKEAVNKYKASVAKPIDLDGLLDLLTEYANDTKVTIINFMPGKTNLQGDYKIINMRLNIKAETFKDIIAFIFAIEKSEYVFRITNWTVTNGANNVFESDIDLICIQLQVK